MGKLTPVSHRELTARLRRLGFEGPFAGGRHLMMTRAGSRVVIPNPHGADIGVDLLSRVLRQAGVTREDWESAGE